ncbi:hypothetical protein, partial [Paenibacillus macerans]
DNRAKAGSRQEQQDTTPLNSPLTWCRFVTLLETDTVQKVDTLTSPARFTRDFLCSRWGWSKVE